MKTSPGHVRKREVVIVGAGFGGLRVVKALSLSTKVTLVDKQNHHLFQPLLYQVATAALSPADIAFPIRGIFKHYDNVRVVMGEATGIDPTAKTLVTQEGLLPYDYLVLATGAHYNYFAHPEWEKWAPHLKTLSDATTIRDQILLAFEKAENQSDPVLRRGFLTFVIVGGGPTGVELAGAIAEIAHRTLEKDFRHIDPHTTRILLLDGMPRILTGFPESLSKKAHAALERLGVEIQVNARVNNVDGLGVTVGEERIASNNVFWAAGVKASPVGEWLKAQVDKSGRVMVNPDLTVPGYPDIFVIGDAASFPDASGKPLPGVAPVAMQQGTFVGKLISRRLEGDTSPANFIYKDKGNLATIGRSFAIADFGTFRMSGFFAWVFWLVLHVFYLIGFRNRLLVILQWAWAYITFQRSARIIMRK